ncbi:hypothetical protein HPDP_00287 [Candidatus Hepatincola sp. Pdp]
MADCPYCKRFDNDLNHIVHDKELKNLFFTNIKKYTCAECYNNFFYIDEKYIKTNTGFKHFKKQHIKEEQFNQLKQQFDKNNLVDYLPNDEFKLRYNDAQEILKTSVSSKSKIATIRPLIESFLNERNGVEEENDIRKSIKTLDNKELHSALHKIVDDTLKGAHIKKEELKNNPKYILDILDTLFTKLYVIPIQKEKLTEGFKKRELAINKQLETQLQKIK